METQGMQKKRKRELFLLVILTFVLIFGLLFLLVTLPNRSLFSESLDKQLMAINTDQLFALKEGESQQVYPFSNEYLMRVSNDLVTYITLNGDHEKNQTVQLQRSIIARNEKFFLVADQGAFNFYLFNTKGLLYHGTTDQNIVKIAVSDSGKSAFLMEEVNSKGVLRVLDEEGRHILDWRVRDRLESGYIINMAFTPDNRYMDVSLINTDGSQVKPIYYRLDLKEAKLSKLITLPGDLVYPVILPSTQESTILVGPSQVMRIEDLQVKPWFHLEQIHDVSLAEEGFAVLGKGQLNATTKLYYIPYSDFQTHSIGVLSHGIEVGNAPLDVEAAFGKIAISDGQGIYLLNESNMSDRNYFASPSTIIRMKFINRNMLLLVTEDRVQILHV